MSRNLLCCTLISVFTLTPLAVKAAEPTAAERANLDLVTRFCESFATRDMAKITALLSPDVVYRITDTVPAVKGAEAIAADPRLRGALRIHRV